MERSMALCSRHCLRSCPSSWFGSSGAVLQKMTGQCRWTQPDRFFPRLLAALHNNLCCMILHPSFHSFDTDLFYFFWFNALWSPWWVRRSVSIPYSVLFLSRVDICLIYPPGGLIYTFGMITLLYYYPIYSMLDVVPNMWTLTLTYFLLRQIPICAIVIYSWCQIIDPWCILILSFLLLSLLYMGNLAGFL